MAPGPTAGAPPVPPARPRRSLPVWPLTAVLALAWLIVNPPTPDLVAHLYRADIVSRAGLTTWDQGWYGGHHLPSYSVLVPLVSALLTPQLAAALAAVGATWLYGRLAADHWRPAQDPPSALLDAATASTIAFAIAVVSALCGGQLTFVCGLAPGLGALLAARRGHLGLAAALGLATTLTSPVVAAFLTLACAAWWVAKRQWAPVACAGGAVVCGLLLAIAFPEGGAQPISTTAQWEAIIVALALVIVVPSSDRALRAGAGLYAAALVVSQLVDNPLGGNLIRLSAVFALPLAVGSLWRRRKLVLVLIALPLIAWQWNVPISSMIQDAGDPSADAAYHAPLLAELDRLERQDGPFRTEIPFTQDHWETRYIAPTHPIARGWERQLDIRRNQLFYDSPPLDARDYRRWLHIQGVRYVALPDVTLDSSSREEGALIRGGLPFLRPIWHNAHWRLYAVTRPTAMATGGARVTAMDLDSLTLRARRPDTTTVVRVHWSPYLALDGAAGCVEPATGVSGDWTRVHLRDAGTARLVVKLSLTRIRAQSPRCTS